MLNSTTAMAGRVLLAGSNESIFYREAPGDVLLYASSASNSILIGNTSATGQSAALSLSASAARAASTLRAKDLTTSAMLSTRITLTMPDAAPAPSASQKIVAPLSQPSATGGLDADSVRLVTAASNAAASALQLSQVLTAPPAGAGSNAAVFRGSLLASTAQQQDLGSAAQPFRAAYFNSASFDSLTVGGVPLGGMTVGDGSNISLDTRVSVLTNSNLAAVPYPNFAWGTTVENSTVEDVRAVAVGADQSVYVAGTYSNGSAVLYDRGSRAVRTVLPWSSNQAVFVARYDPSGNVQWATTATIQPTTSNIFATGVAVSPTTGNVYMCGSYRGSPTILDPNGQPTAVSMPTSATTNTAYLTCLNSNGVAQWARTLDGNAAAQAVAVDSNDLVAFVGSYQFSNAGTLGLRVPNLTAGFLATFNSNGDLQWTGSVDALTGSRQEDSTAVAVDGGSVYVGGHSTAVSSSGGLLVYGASNTNHLNATVTANDTWSSYLVRFSSNGRAQWISRAQVNNASGQTIVSGLAAQGSNVYLYGRLLNVTTFQVINAGNSNSTLQFPSLSAFNSAYLLNYSPAGAARWAAFYDGGATSIPGGAAADAAGNVALLGVCRTTGGGRLRVFNAPVNSTILESAYTPFLPQDSSFMLKFSPQGQLAYVAAIHGGGGTVGNAVAIDGSNGAYVGGNFMGSVITYSNGYTTNGNTALSSPGSNAMLLRFNDTSTLSPTSYRLVARTDRNGMIKYMVNASDSSTAHVIFRNSNDTATLSNLYMAPGTAVASMNVNGWTRIGR